MPDAKSDNPPTHFRVRPKSCSVRQARLQKARLVHRVSGIPAISMRSGKPHRIFGRVERGSPACTGSSTNASCQLEKAENWYAETWGPASTPGVECASPRIEVSNEREAVARNRCEMWRIRAGAASSAAVKIMGLGVGT